MGKPSGPGALFGSIKNTTYFISSSVKGTVSKEFSELRIFSCLSHMSSAKVTQVLPLELKIFL
jgi:hypothetical protein